MDKRRFAIIWKDPVWSKVISVGIVAILTIGYNFIVAKLNGIAFSSSFKNFWTFKIDLWILFFLTAVIATVYFLFNNRFKYDEQTLALDRALFKQIREAHSITDLFLEIKSNGFSSRPVESNTLSTMFSLIGDSKRADFQFLNPYLEKLKNKVIREFDNLGFVLSGNIYGAHNAGWLSIPSEWEFTQPERMRKAISDIEKQENIVASTFQEFITKGRKTLKV